MHRYSKDSVKHLEVQANVLARKEFGYLDSWDQYPEFTKVSVDYEWVIIIRIPGISTGFHTRRVKRIFGEKANKQFS